MSDKIELIFAAVDQQSKTIDAIDKRLASMETRVNSNNTALATMAGRVSKIGSVLTGIAQGFGIRIFDALDDGVHRLLDAIPDLIDRGEQWAQTVRKIQEITGLTAERSSDLAGAAHLLGLDENDLATGLARVAQHLVGQPELLQKYGISLEGVHTSGDLAWSVLTQIQAKVAQLGPSFFATAEAQSLFGRGGYNLLRLLQQSPQAFQLLIDQVRAAGAEMTQQGLSWAQVWELTKNRIDLTLTGIGSQILGRVAPALSGLVDSIATSIQLNMDQIVQFVVQVVNFVAGVISGLFGLNLSLTSFGQAVVDATPPVQDLGSALDSIPTKADKASSGTDAFTRSIQRQIDAIDSQLAALEARKRAFDAARERDKLLADIATAQAQLDDVKSKGIFLAGMTETEKELARQKQQADILDAQKAVSDAKQALANHDRDVALEQQRQMLQDQRTYLEKLLQQHEKAMQQIANSVSDPYAKLRNFLKNNPIQPPKVELPKMTDAITQAAKDALAAGQQFAAQLMNALFGKLSFSTSMAGAPSQLAPANATRSGGLIDSIANLVGGVGGLMGSIGSLVTTLKPIADFVGSLGIGNTIGQGLDTIKRWLDDVKTGNWLDLLLGTRPGTYPPTPYPTPQQPAPYQAPIPQQSVPPGTVGMIGGPGIYGAAWTPAMSEMLLAGVGQTAQNTGLYGPISQSLSDAYYATREAADNTGATVDTMTNGVTVQGQDLSLIGAHTLTTAGNTQPMADGTVGVTNGQFGYLGSYLPGIHTNTNPLADGTLGVQNSQFSYLGNYLPGIHTRTGNTADYLYGTMPATSYLGLMLNKLSSIDLQTYGSQVKLNAIDYGFRNVYPNKGFATGGAGLTNGLMNAVMGEAGQEAYAILRNPRPLRGGGYASGDAQERPSKLSVEVPVPVVIELDGRKIGETVVKFVVQQGMANDTSWSPSR